MSKSEIIENVHRFLTKIEGDDLNNFPKFQLEAKALRWDLESVFHFSDSQPENSAERPHLFKYCGVVEHPDGSDYCYKCGGALKRRKQNE